MSDSSPEGYTVVQREQATDLMAEAPEYGEMRWFTEATGAQQVSFSWRRVPAGTGGRGTYGHRHPGQEEVFFVISGTITFKVGDDVFEVGPRSAVLIDGDAFRSLHNDTDHEAELLIFSTKLDPAPAEKKEGFWPE